MTEINKETPMKDLTFTNCYTYNGETTPVGLMCTNVKNEYHKLYNLYSMQKFL